MQPQANLSVDDVLAFSDVDLVEYMKNNRRPDGAFKLGNIDGWERLPSDQRHQLAERLRFGAQKASQAITSRPVDLDEVAARLLQISAERDKSTRSSQSPSRRERSLTEAGGFDSFVKGLETEAYNKLVGDGGRPVYPIDHLDHVSQHPEAYRELLRPWQGGWPDLDPPRWDMVFRRQWETWKHFREWQVDNREVFNEEAEFSAFVEEAKKQHAEAKKLRSEETRKVLDNRYREWLKEEYQKLSSRTAVPDDDEGFLAFVEEKRQEALKQGMEWAAETEDEYVQVLRTQFNEKRACRRWFYFYPLREDRGQGGFAGYVDEAQRRLARHGFPGTFHFDEDPKRQDSLTTWIEYVNYECAWYDDHVRAVERLRPRHEEAWKALVDSGVLRPGETEEYLLTDESALQRQAEIDQAEMAVKSAEEFAEAALRETAKARVDPRRSRYTKEEPD
ncbi:2c21dfe6-ac02-4bdf-bd79-7703c72d2fae [Thermothielavioides terrestris]|uniref:2c21dfe6-ac02-4bdf-bd79-7703c72d2fae n=1 Tax=Thermothielavioides terrestris TaxID=2587410 RepID=A0A3S4AMJ1_9PEZI|nr:2c21dfe6-ac02-4bdf-bd79-7703c72d2fae [Thermothielavioides terrestris]